MQRDAAPTGRMSISVQPRSSEPRPGANDRQLRLPASYLRGVAVRAVLPKCAAEDVVGLAFDMPDGTVLRLAVPSAGAALLRDVLSEAHGLRDAA